MDIKTDNVTIQERSAWSQERYYSTLKPAAYGLWTGKLDTLAFAEMLEAAVIKGLSEAWYQGAESVGVKRDELTDDEITAMQTSVYEQLLFTRNLSDYIISQDKSSGGLWSTVEIRLRMWANKFTDFVNRGRVMSKLDQKLKWNYDAQKEHCEDCARLNNHIKRASQWRDWVAAGNEWPGGWRLQCHGIWCGCSLDPTDEPLSKGKLPNIVGK